jgi:hypothetical protein
MRRIMEKAGFGWNLVVLGLVITVIGLFWAVGPRWLKLGRLPGDIVIETEHTRFYFPIVTCLLVSVVLSLVLWLVRLFSR